HEQGSADEQATQGGSHVELESDVTDEEPASSPAETAVAAVVESDGSGPVEAALDVQPAPRGRRRRARVVAPAGPPRSSGGAGGMGDA
ncbi:MAG: hypothetical protein HOQ27_06345, partial [Dermatophilaceae bacterium]|nr:hypothetical protein [Dermatophilaceae bacterium]